ncbi:MAG: PQQ-dependent sugar dehydrogenase [Flavipsychrobacter sp.]|nr:PQQ-dependent sugar dehydrogenase [Flavipsychrobacter sp.]
MKIIKPFACLFFVLIWLNAFAQTGSKSSIADGNNAGLILPKSFAAIKLADNIGKSRHIAVTPQGDIYVKQLVANGSKGILLLREEKGTGRAAIIKSFGDYGGTGIAIKNGYLYASSDVDIYRYKLDDKGIVIDPEHPEKIVNGLLERHEHESKSIVLDDDGYIYTNIGAYSNSCQERDRVKGSPGMKPCPILDSAGGIWRFKADLPNQTYANGTRYATGLRNVVGLDWNKTTNSLFVMMHGRDQLHDLFPQYYDEKQSAELPAETMYELHNGSNCGWPYMYYDQQKHQKILAPEYGGDGVKQGGENAQDPVAAFPGHLAPNGLLFYTGTMFPEKYRNGAFIAFHGSWNRAPEKQKGFLVAFVPLKNGKPSGDWEIFADNFAGTNDITSPRQAAHRPCGLAQGPDGALYVSDDVKGAIYKIIYTGK